MAVAIDRRAMRDSKSPVIVLERRSGFTASPSWPQSSRNHGVGVGQSCGIFGKLSHR